MRRLWMMSAAMAWVVFAAPPAVAYDDGFYFSFGIGYAHGMGDRGVSIQPPPGCPSELSFDTGVDPTPFLWPEGNRCVYMPVAVTPGITAAEVNAQLDARLDEVVRTDAGPMMGLQLRLGYNILGYASVEAALSGAGAGTFDGGSAHVAGQVRLHPVQFFIPHQDRDWDVSTFVGAGYSLAGYKPQFDPELHGGGSGAVELNRDAAFDGKGWEGIHVGFGVGFDYQFGDLASVGLDLKFLRPLYSMWIANFEEPYEAPPVSTPEAWIVTPTVRVTLHFWSPEE